MPWVPKGEKAEAAAAEEVEKPQKKTREPRSKGEGKASESKGGGDKGGKKGKSKGEGDKGGDKGGGKKGKGKGKEEERSWDKGGSRGWDSGGKGGKGSKGDSKGDSKGKSFKGDDEAGKRGPKGGKKGDKGGKSNDRPPLHRGDDEERPERTDRPLRSEDMRRQATASSGKHCTVRKHSSMGCAVVSMHSPQTRQAILAAGLKLEIQGHTLTIRAHFEKETKEEIMTDIFAGWGRQAEKTDPLSEEALTEYFDEKHIEFTTTGRCSAQAGGARPMTEDEKRAAAQKTAEAQAQWAASGGQQSPSGRAPVPVGPAPGGMPGALLGAPGQAQAALSQQQAQAQQAQYMAAMQAQAQYVMRYQQQQAAYYAAAQAQQVQQQQAWMQHLKAQQEAQAEKSRKAGGIKAPYRIPTDDEVKATLQRAGRGAPDAGAAEPAAADPAEAYSVPPTVGVATAAEAVGEGLPPTTTTY